jgi:murein DD-endopeptidase MepM/ murein hydrolase activator NlpD
MKKILILIVVFIIFSFIVFMFVMQDYLFPATYAAAVDQSLWGSIPNYGGQVVIWASSMETGGAGYDGMIFVGSVGFDGYEGPLSFLCGNLVQETVTYITDCFGTLRECTGGPCPHTGIDIGTNYQEGFPVQTPFGGKVIAVGAYGGWGNIVAIENNGYQVLLSHFSGINVAVGDIVEAGDIVGISGGQYPRTDSESTTGPHLHFEIRECREDSDGEIRCYAINPITTILPGQSDICNWFGVVSDPSRNVQCAGDNY